MPASAWVAAARAAEGAIARHRQAGFSASRRRRARRQSHRRFRHLGRRRLHAGLSFGAAHLPALLLVGETAFGYLKFDAYITGAPAHAGGKPEGGHNAMLAAATAVLNLYSIPRHSQGVTRINVGRLQAGTGRNVIPPAAHLAIETRGATSDLNQHMYDYAVRVLENAAAMHGCTVRLQAMGGAKSGNSDPALAQRVSALAQQISDFDRVTGIAGGGGSEDFTYMMERVQQNGGQATFINVGADFNGAGHHTAEFDFDERAMRGAVKLFAAAALDLMHK